MRTIGKRRTRYLLFTEKPENPGTEDGSDKNVNKAQREPHSGDRKDGRKYNKFVE